MGFGMVSKKYLQKRIESVGSNEGFPTFVKSKYERYKMKDGDNFIRILPPHESDKEGVDMKEVYVHTYVGMDKGSYLCLEKMKGEDCPICRKMRRFLKDGVDEEIIKKLKPKRQSIMWILDTSTKDSQSNDPLLFLSPVSITNEIIHRSQSRKTGEVIDVSSQADGREIIFTKEGKGINTKYVNVEISDEPYPVKNNVADKIVPLVKTLKFLTDEELLLVVKTIVLEDLTKDVEDSKSKEKKFRR